MKTLTPSFKEEIQIYIARYEYEEANSWKYFYNQLTTKVQVHKDKKNKKEDNRNEISEYGEETHTR